MLSHPSLLRIPEVGTILPNFIQIRKIEFTEVKNSQLRKRLERAGTEKTGLMPNSVLLPPGRTAVGKRGKQRLPLNHGYAPAMAVAVAVIFIVILTHP